MANDTIPFTKCVVLILLYIVYVFFDHSCWRTYPSWCTQTSSELNLQMKLRGPGHVRDLQNNCCRLIVNYTPRHVIASNCTTAVFSSSDSNHVPFRGENSLSIRHQSTRPPDRKSGPAATRATFNWSIRLSPTGHPPVHPKIRQLIRSLVYTSPH